MPDSNLHESRATDPSQLTTRQILREVSLLEDKLVVRLTAEEKSIDKLFSNFERVPEIIDRSVAQLNLVHTEKFNSIQTQFRERDTRAEQTSKDSKTAVDTALLATKEAFAEQNKSSALAITKSEISTAKQMDQINTLIQASNKSTDEKITDLKSRLDLGAGQQVGVKAVKDDSKSWIAIVVSVCGVLAMIAIELVRRQ